VFDATQWACTASILTVACVGVIPVGSSGSIQVDISKMASKTWKIQCQRVRNVSADKWLSDSNQTQTKIVHHQITTSNHASSHVQPGPLFLSLIAIQAHEQTDDRCHLFGLLPIKHIKLSFHLDV